MITKDIRKFTKKNHYMTQQNKITFQTHQLARFPKLSSTVSLRHPEQIMRYQMRLKKKKKGAFSTNRIQGGKSSAINH